MTEDERTETHCVPYEKRGRYYVSTAILFIVQGLIFLYLWTINPIYSLMMIVLYLATSYFQSYCCVYQDCPYIGEMCPAISGIYVGNIFAQKLYSKDTPKDEKRFHRHKNLGILFWLLMVFFPLYWIYLLDLYYAIFYVIFHLGYFVLFGLTICPSCAIKETCPGGALQKSILKKT